jgi:hypothetical protein
LDFGFDLFGGIRFYSPKTPNSVKSIDVIASDNSIVRVNCPDSKMYYDGIAGLRFYIGYYSDSPLLSFKIGTEPLTCATGAEEKVPSAKGVVMKEYYVASTDWNQPWGASPKVGVYCDPKIKNILFIEKDLVWFGNKDNTMTLNLIGKLDYYDITWNTFAAKYPYGDEWYSDLDSLIVSSNKVDHTRGFAERIGLGLRFSGIPKYVAYSGGVDLTYGNILRKNEIVEPNLEFKLYFGLRF